MSDSTAFNRQYRLKPGDDFFLDKRPKRLIVLHFIAHSNVLSAYNEFAQEGHKATPYLVGEDGKIYELYEPEYWAYHLFAGDRGGADILTAAQRKQIEQESIGIEIANVGPLKPDGTGALCWWPNSWTKKYCSVFEHSKYMLVSTPVVDAQHFATFPLVQVDAVAGLVKFLCTKFDIPVQYPKDWMNPDFDFMLHGSGIVNHRNCRLDKYDIGPAFPLDYFKTQLTGA